MIGDRDVQTVSVSTSESGKSTSVSMRTERTLPPDAIRALPKGRALLFATGIRPVMLNLRPWYKEPAARVIGPASAAATKAISARALEKAKPNRGAVEAAE
jgi:type IV secretory pathway TraG/TraD family ATPase VirD4